MANTKKPQQSSSTSPYNAPRQAQLEAAHFVYQQFVQNITPYVNTQGSILVGLSGGLDSCVLLHLLAQLRSNCGFTLQAMHVHHGISQHADDWLNFCKNLCHQYNIDFHAQHVSLNPNSGLGIEAEARMLRYQALFDTQADMVCVAHHEDDQAETLLLQLLRGAGVRGLSSMAACDVEKRLLRPLLNISRKAIEQYAQAHQLKWVEDESNLVESYDRNFIRQRVMPILNTRYPKAQHTLARVAAHMAEAQALADDLAQLDANGCIENARLLLVPFLSLSLIRQKNLMRWWLNEQQIRMPSAAKLEVMLQQLRDAKADTNLQILLDAQQGLVLRRYHGAVYITKRQSGVVNQPLQWQGEESLQLADGSKLIFSYQQGQGLDLSKVNRQLTIAYRKGGERFKPHAARPTRTLKHLLQEAKMPPSVREQLPLVFKNDVLVMVPSIGVADEYQASKDCMGLVIDWQPA